MASLRSDLGPRRLRDGNVSRLTAEPSSSAHIGHVRISGSASPGICSLRESTSSCSPRSNEAATSRCDSRASDSRAARCRPLRNG